MVVNVFRWSGFVTLKIPEVFRMRLHHLAAGLSVMFGILVAQPASANFSCSGSISYLAVNANDVVFAAVGNFGVWAVCRLSETSQGVSEDACKAWYASLLAAKRAGTGVVFYFESSASGNNGSECTALGNWTGPTSYHMDVL